MYVKMSLIKGGSSRGRKGQKSNRVGTHLPFAVAVLTRPHLSVSETKDISEPNPIAQYRHWASHLRSRFHEIVRFLRRDS